MRKWSLFARIGDVLRPAPFGWTSAILLLALYALALPCMAVDAQEQPTPAIGMGLYQSEHLKIDTPQETEEGPYRFFLRIFGDGRVSMVLSPADAEQVYQQFDRNPDMAGTIRYTVYADGISFDFGPTAHMVTATGDARIRLQSIYANGREAHQELKLVIPEHTP